MDRLIFILRRVLIVVVALPLVIFVVMVLIATLIGAISAVFIHPASAPSGPFGQYFLADDYISRMFQIIGLVLVYELYLLFIIVAFPFLLASGELKW